MVSFSLCMIVKDESKVLARCLDSVQGVFEQIVVVDTGSSDSTVSIAKKYTDEVYNFLWTDDFSAARNFAFSKSQCDYTMWLDADDVISEDSRKKLIELKSGLTDEYKVVMLPYNTAFDEEGNPTFTFYRERLVNRATPHLWQGAVHETIDCKGKKLYEDIPIDHRSVKTHYSDRNLKIYEKLIKEGKTLCARDIFYYGRELYYHAYYDNAVKVITPILSDKSAWKENRIEACRILGLCYKALGKYKKALGSLMYSFLIDTPRAEIMCEIGSIFKELGNYKSAVYWYSFCVITPVNPLSGAFINKDAYTYIPYIEMCVCFFAMGDREKAVYCNEMAGKYRPKAKAYLYNKSFFGSLQS